MKKAGIVIIAVIGFSHCVLGQQIYMERTFGGARFETDSLTLSLHQVSELMEENPVAYDEFKKARLNYGVSGVLGFAGGLLVAIPVVTAVIGGKPEWTLAAVGGAFILVSIPFTRNFYRHAENAVEDYDVKYQTRVRTNFYFTATGGKLVIKF